MITPIDFQMLDDRPPRGGEIDEGQGKINDGSLKRSYFPSLAAQAYGLIDISRFPVVAHLSPGG